MPLVRRLSRAFQTVLPVKLDERSLVGIAGEDYASQFLAGPAILGRVSNPVLPHPSVPGRWLETDHLVYTQGNLFCVEIKNYRGRISYGDGEGSTIVQEKLGSYGEWIPPKPHKSPLRQVTAFIHHLKKYLSARVDPRFRRLHIIAVAAFVRNADTDISAVWNSEAGMIWVDQLPAFFAQRANPMFASRPSRWVAEGIQQLPRPDVVLTTDRHALRGFIEDTQLVFTDTNRRWHSLPYAEVTGIGFDHGGLFSASDEVTVTFKNGRTLQLTCAGGSLWLRTLDGKRQPHRLRNIIQVTPGRPFLPDSTPTARG